MTADQVAALYRKHPAIAQRVCDYRGTGGKMKPVDEMTNAEVYDELCERFGTTCEWLVQHNGMGLVATADKYYTIREPHITADLLDGWAVREWLKLPTPRGKRHVEIRAGGCSAQITYCTFSACPPDVLLDGDGSTPAPRRLPPVPDRQGCALRAFAGYQRGGCDGGRRAARLCLLA